MAREPRCTVTIVPRWNHNDSSHSEAKNKQRLPLTTESCGSGCECRQAFGQLSVQIISPPLHHGFALG